MKKILNITFTALFIAGVLISCQNEDSLEPVPDHQIQPEMKKDNNKGKGKKHSTTTDTTTNEITYTATYSIFQADDTDPLDNFSISSSGDKILLRTDPDVTSWGTDYWGYWSDPYNFDNNVVSYTIGLSQTTYYFKFLNGNKIDISKKVVVQPYLGGNPTVETTHPGTYIMD